MAHFIISIINIQILRNFLLFEATNHLALSPAKYNKDVGKSYFNIVTILYVAKLKSKANYM